MKRALGALSIAAVCVSFPSSALPTGAGLERAPMPRLVRIASAYSCSARKTCKKIASCEEAYWYLATCSWGGKLDRDGDGVPCETICPGG